MEDLIYEMLLTLSQKTIDDGGVRAVVVNFLNAGRKASGTFNGYSYIKQAKEAVGDAGYQRTALYKHLRRWVAMH